MRPSAPSPIPACLCLLIPPQPRPTGFQCPHSHPFLSHCDLGSPFPPPTPIPPCIYVPTPPKPYPSVSRCPHPPAPALSRCSHPLSPGCLGAPRPPQPRPAPATRRHGSTVPRARRQSAPARREATPPLDYVTWRPPRGASRADRGRYSSPAALSAPTRDREPALKARRGAGRSEERESAVSSNGCNSIASAPRVTAPRSEGRVAEAEALLGGVKLLQ